MFGHWIKNHKFTFALAAIGTGCALANNWWTLTNISFMGDAPGTEDTHKKIAYLLAQMGLSLIAGATVGLSADLILRQQEVYNNKLNQIIKHLGIEQTHHETNRYDSNYQSLEMR